MARATLSLVSVLLTVCVNCIAAPTTKTKVCPDSEFYDHGTELCEPCMVICKNAHIMNTVEQCQYLCPATYAQLNNKQEKPKVSAQSVGTTKDQPTTTTSTSRDNMFIVAGVISGVVIVAFLVILGAYMCKRVQENPELSRNRSQAPSASSAEQGTNASRQGYRPAGMQENEEQAASKQVSQPQGLRNYCDPRQWFSVMPAEETVSGRQGPQEIALLGNSNGSVVQDFQRMNTVVIATPIYKPSGPMRSSRI